METQTPLKKKRKSEGKSWIRDIRDWGRVGNSSQHTPPPVRRLAAGRNRSSGRGSTEQQPRGLREQDGAGCYQRPREKLDIVVVVEKLPETMGK